MNLTLTDYSKMDALLNTAAEKTKEFAHNVVEKITGPSEVTDKEIVKAIEHQERLQHDLVEKNIKAEKKVAKLAEHLAKKKNEAYIESLEADLKLGEKKCDVLQEARRKEMIDRAAAEKISGAAVKVDHLQGDQLFTGYNTSLNKNLKNAAEKAVDLEHELFKKDASAQLDIIKAIEKLEDEAHKQKLNSLEAGSDLDKAAAALEKQRVKKFEAEMAAEAKVRKAADKVSELQSKQVQQKCKHVVNTPLRTGTPLAGVGVANGTRLVTITKTTEIH